MNDKPVAQPVICEVADGVWYIRSASNGHAILMLFFCTGRIIDERCFFHLAPVILDSNHRPFLQLKSEIESPPGIRTRGIRLTVLAVRRRLRVRFPGGDSISDFSWKSGRWLPSKNCWSKMKKQLSSWHFVWRPLHYNMLICWMCDTSSRPVFQW